MTIIHLRPVLGEGAGVAILQMEAITAVVFGSVHGEVASIATNAKSIASIAVRFVFAEDIPVRIYEFESS